MLGMMTNIESLHDLLEHDLRDIYSAEKLIQKALPRMIKNATSTELVNALETHLSETEDQISKVESVFRMLGKEPNADNCEGIEGILLEGEKTMKLKMSPELMDAAIICGAQKVEHYEICAYGTMCAFAHKLGLHDVEDVLQSILREEKSADSILTRIAETSVNNIALDKGSSSVAA